MHATTFAPAKNSDGRPPAVAAAAATPAVVIPRHNNEVSDGSGWRPLIPGYGLLAP